MGLEGLVRNRAATGTRLPLTLRLCPNVERSIPGAMGHCGARHSVSTLGDYVRLSVKGKGNYILYTTSLPM